MNRQIYAFLIPLGVLLLLGFTPASDLLMKGFKDEINIEERKLYTYVSHKNATVKFLQERFRTDIPVYREFIETHVTKDGNVTMHLLNYLYYINQRSIAMVRNHKVNQPSKKDYNESKLIDAVMQKDYLGHMEYQCVLDSYGEVKESMIDFYKAQNDLNRQIAVLTYAMIKDFPRKEKEKAVSGLRAGKCSSIAVYGGIEW